MNLNTLKILVDNIHSLFNVSNLILNSQIFELRPCGNKILYLAY